MTVLDRFRIDGKVAIVTGGGGSIGGVYAQALAEAGAAVALADIDGGRAEKAAAGLAAAGHRAVGVQVDITDRASTDRMAAEVAGAFGGIDILVNNAALMAEIPPLDLLETTDEWFDRTMKVNVLGAMHTSASVKAAMVERGGGRIINQSSSGGWMGGTIYGMSKLTISSVTSRLARTMGPLGINVNAIAPGMVRNEPGLRSLPDDSPGRNAIAASIPGQSEGAPEDLTGTLLLLASDAGKWINGQTIGVDGGWIMHL